VTSVASSPRPAPTPACSILDAVHDLHLFARWFEPLGSWGAWLVLLRAIFGLAMTPSEREIFQRFTGRTVPPRTPAREAWLVVGRRGGKSRIAALIAVFVACFRDYRPVLAPGERATVMVLAADREQARVVFGYIEALLDQVPMLKALVVHQTKEEIYLRHRIVIRVQTASFRAVRGYTVVAAICDEVAFWSSEDSANPDVEIVHAIRPAMATVPEPLLLGISSPYARKGLLWDMVHRHYGRDGDPVLVWQADTAAMNPVVDRQIIADAYAADPAAARAEYGAEFRTDVETFLSREVVEACVVPGRHVLPPAADLPYVAFVDPSGGVGDSFALAIAHREGASIILDLLHERRAPLSPAETVAEFVALLRPYRLTRVTGDRYSEEFIREHFQTHGIHYTVSDRTKSDLFVEMLPLLTSGRAHLLDDTRLVAQLLSLERRTGGSGKDAITHPRGGHDDLANAAAGALVRAARTDVALFEDFAEEGRRLSETGPLPEPRTWYCPAPGCGFQTYTDERAPRCLRCHPKGPTLRDLGLRAS
jgi:hypothetical protein